MKLLLLPLFTLLLLFSISSTVFAFKYDLVVYSATPAGIAAAISACMYTPALRIALLEPSFSIGGMSVAGGIGLRDLGEEYTINGTIAERWTLLNAQYYNVDYRVYQPDMGIAYQTLQSLISSQGCINVFLNETLSEDPDAVVKSGSTITSIRTLDGYVWEAEVFIDAGYEGDLLVRAKVSYTYGRESINEYGEKDAGVQPYITTGNFLKNYSVLATVSAQNNSKLVPLIDPKPLAPVGSADKRMMGYSYRLCITQNSSNKVLFPIPEEYNPDDFILLQRYVDSLVNSGQYPKGPPLDFLVDVLDYRNYPPGDKFDLCDSADSAFTSDAINLNKEYVTATYAERVQIAENHYNYVMGMLTYLATAPSIPSYTRESTLSYGLCADQWKDNGNIPTQLYIREGVRMNNSQVYTQNILVGGKYVEDSIGLGSWRIDIHVMSRTARTLQNGTLVADNEGQIFIPIDGVGDVYEMPYSMLVPRAEEASNLIVPVCLAASHVAYGSLRVEPHFMILGEATGIAAAIAIDSDTPVQQLNVKDIQNELSARGVYYHVPTSVVDQ